MASALAARDRRTAVVYVRVSAAEKRALERWATAAGLPLAVLLRATAAEAAAAARLASPNSWYQRLRGPGGAAELAGLELARLASSSFPGEVVDQVEDLMRQIRALLPGRRVALAKITTTPVREVELPDDCVCCGMPGPVLDVDAPDED